VVAKNRMQNNYDGPQHRGVHLFGWLIMGLVLVVAVAIVAGLVYSAFNPGVYPMPYRYGFFFPIGFLIFFFIVFGFARLLLWPWGWGYGRAYWGGHGDPKQILKRRYARGEITKDQFEQMMKDLDQYP
jgi:putative membrane protein